MTYGQIAEYIANLARVVGNILHNNPNEKEYPCYKVVNHERKLSNYFAFGGLEEQKRDLKKME